MWNWWLVLWPSSWSVPRQTGLVLWEWCQAPRCSSPGAEEGCCASGTPTPSHLLERSRATTVPSTVWQRTVTNCSPLLSKMQQDHDSFYPFLLLITIFFVFHSDRTVKVWEAKRPLDDGFNWMITFDPSFKPGFVHWKSVWMIFFEVDNEEFLSEPKVCLDGVSVRFRRSTWTCVSNTKLDTSSVFRGMEFLLF